MVGDAAFFNDLVAARRLPQGADQLGAHGVAGARGGKLAAHQNAKQIQVAKAKKDPVTNELVRHPQAALVQDFTIFNDNRIVQ